MFNIGHNLFSRVATAGSIGLLLAASVFVANLHAAWGARPVLDNYFPDTSWVTRFSTQVDVVADASIEQAIARCDQVVGVWGFCVVQIADSAVREPFEINRSRTKIVGFPGMLPLRAHDNENTITVSSDTRQVVIEGLELEGRNANWNEIFGIVVWGENINGVVIRDNHIHHYNSNANAHAIGVFGTADTGRRSVRNIVIDNNLIHNMRTGSSETIALNGNVFRWAVTNNDISNVNNIAIDAIGGEGIAPTQQTSSGRVLPGVLDSARYGFILNNRVENLSTRDNPAYGNQLEWAAAIYVDGGQYVEIADNEVINAPWAYEVGAENCVYTRHVTLTGNSATASYYGDLLLGGYSEIGFDRDPGIDCNPLSSVDASEGHGYVKRVTITDNRFDSGSNLLDSVLAQFRLRGALIIEPGVSAVNDRWNGGAPGDQNAISTTLQ